MNHENAVSKAMEIADRILAAAARQNDKEARFSSEAVAALGAAGLLGIKLPAEVGGSALGPRTFAAVVATLAEADASAAMVYLMHMCATATIAAARPGATVAQTLKDIAAGRHLTTLAFSEAGSRSHFWAPVSRAKRNGAGVCITAKKSWVTSAGHASNRFDPLPFRQWYARTIGRRPMGWSRHARQRFRADDPRGVRGRAWSSAD